MSRPYEESVIAEKLMRPVSVEKIGNVMYTRVLPRITANSAYAGTGLDVSALGHTGTVEEIPCTPLFSYAFVELTDHLMSKLGKGDSGQVKAMYRKGLMKAVNVVFDADAGTLGSGFSNQLGLPSNFDQSLLLAAKGLLVTNAKEFVDFNSGTPNINLCYHPSQMQYVDAIPGITQAYARGDKQNPTVKGVVHDAWGLSLAETGNIYTAAGVAYNMLFTRQAGVAGYNLEAKLKGEQEDYLVTRIICEGEAGFDELFDECGVCIRSAA